MASRKRCHRGLEVQSLIFPGSWSTSRAIAWARAHGFRGDKTDVTGQSVRLRQRPPRSFTRGSFRTISLSRIENVRAVVGCPKRGHESDKRLRRASRDEDSDGWHLLDVRTGCICPIGSRRAAEARAQQGNRAAGETRLVPQRSGCTTGRAPEERPIVFEAHDPDRRRRDAEAQRDRLSTRGREHLRASQFALPEARKFPIHDAAHARNAAARLEQARRRGTISRSAYIRARARIRRAERRFGIRPGN